MALNLKVADAAISVNRLLEHLRNGTPPWQKPWTGVPNTATNIKSGKPYTGINTVMLWAAGMGYELPLWATAKQAAELGGTVRDGEAYSAIVKFTVLDKRQPDGSDKRIGFWKYYQVYNIAQMDGVAVPDAFQVKREPVPVLDGVNEALRYDGGPSVRHEAGDRAYYLPSADQITLPLLEQFTSAEAYAATALHEAVHSTGHKSRLDRLDGSPFGCEGYAKEELVAEIGAAMLADALNIKVEWQQHAAYCASWLKVLENDTALLFDAAKAAQKAVDRIIGTATEQEQAA